MRAQIKGLGRISLTKVGHIFTRVIQIHLKPANTRLFICWRKRTLWALIYALSSACRIQVSQWMAKGSESQGSWLLKYWINVIGDRVTDRWNTWTRDSVTSSVLHHHHHQLSPPWEAALSSTQLHNSFTPDCKSGHCCSWTLATQKQRQKIFFLDRELALQTETDKTLRQSFKIFESFLHRGELLDHFCQLTIPALFVLRRSKILSRRAHPAPTCTAWEFWLSRTLHFTKNAQVQKRVEARGSAPIRPWPCVPRHQQTIPWVRCLPHLRFFFKQQAQWRRL